MGVRLDWLIVGGGVHGTYLSHVLTNRAGVSPDRVRVLDPHDVPLETFWRVSSATGMKYLRSPGVHHLDLHPFSLRRFAKHKHGREHAQFTYPYDRPGVGFFRMHTEHVIQEHGLARMRERGHATLIERIDGGYRVETERGVLDARRVVLALGLGEQLCFPEWVHESVRDRVDHVFSPSFRRDEVSRAARVAIVGGGISAAQLASSLMAAGTHVEMIARHPLRVHRFDSDPGWLGPRAMRSFARVNDVERRRAMIASARHRGSIPPEIAADLKREMRHGGVRWIEAETVAAERSPLGVMLRLDRAPYSLEVERVVLATGFESHRPGKTLLSDEAVDRLGLPCAACGYPIVSPRLEWAEGLFVTGPLAELEIGPTARNIAGARTAGERLLAMV